MKNFNKALITTATILALTACGGSNESVPEEKVPETVTYGPLSTGSVSESVFAYFDLETMTELTLTEEEAASNTVWDIAFKRSGVYLNNASDTPVSAYFTGNNSDFFDADGNAVKDSFINATPESELEDFTIVTSDDIPTEEGAFVTDVTNNIIDGFYVYNTTTHQVTADDTHYFIIHSDDTFSKIRATALSSDESGYAMGEITLSYANQMSSDTEFGAEQALVIDTAATCAGFDGIYVDFDLGQTVAMGDNWDLSIPCNDNKTAAEFSMNIASDAKALQDFENSYDAMDLAAINYYNFQSNEYSVKAFDANPWYQYGVNGGHTLWSQYGVYLIQTESATYKFQITSYYDTENVSGNISFRAKAL